jgi:hypothetical protein
VSYQLGTCAWLIRLASTALKLFPAPAVSQEQQAIRLRAVKLPSAVSTFPPFLIVIANLDYSVRFAREVSLEQHRLQHEERDRALERQRREAFALDLPTYSGSLGLMVPPTTPSSTFQNVDAIVLDALAWDDIDTLFARLTQAPNLNLIPCTLTVNQSQSQIGHCDQQQDVVLSGLAHQTADQPVQQQFHDWSLPPAARRSNRSFPNYYTDDTSIAYNEDGWL